MRRAVLLALLALPGPAAAESALVAVATNFRPVAEILAEEFTAETGHEIRLAAAATGKLAAQVASGAPFDVFLSADEATVDELIAEGQADPADRFTYAIGQLVLWTADGRADLSDPAAFLAAQRHVAIANPDLAPYGKAALQAIDSLGFSDAVEGKIVQGENIGQTFAMVRSGAAGAGFVAASGLHADPTLAGGSWPVPESAHDPIRQDAVLLVRGKGNAAALAFLDHLRGTKARAVIEANGYATLP
ncbi:molybdate ABC transporter substrate-binding protein [Defluviimonas sp. WL0024]|uniref:Molybdate ABC transporter substrate-binding protein n=2 Tax=Albidovulum TaxID=205889 RepID=A0ABT3J0P9_9RHOB|nr:MULTISPECIES: molybdate ABC transporter substrate-binding protein [Defluviimonas]MCU9846998.1 molybdate ABC transporter substrate-binding protein [Defluviimonas sp. WL0024]MCW3781257.1 molybdate ABC transporter substrate-binding protein [Defluviimonas salinarum]